MLRLKEGWPRCDKTGWLSKQAHDSDEWKRVWVVLKGCLLLLFEDATVRGRLYGDKLSASQLQGFPPGNLYGIHIFGALYHGSYCDHVTAVVQEVRPLEVMNVQHASISEMSLQDPWRAEFSRHSKGLLIKVCTSCSMLLSVQGAQ